VNRIHILHVLPVLGRGGTELAMAQLMHGLDGEDFRHSVACLKGDADIGGALPSTAEVVCLHGRSNEPQLPLRLARLMRRLQPSVIHARNSGAWPDAATARLLHWPMVPLMLSFHGSLSAAPPPWRWRAASWLMARTATCLLTLSQRSAEFAAAQWHWPAGRIRVIPNGVDTTVFRPAAAKEPRDRVVVGSAGRLTRVKNFALLVRACAKLVQSGTDLELRIAGEGDEHANLTRLAEELGFSSRLKLCGFVKDVAGFLTELDVFVLPSNTEQHPNALTEALACGVASVATSVGCVEELLDAGRCGIAVAAGDQPAMESAIRTLVADRSLRETLGMRARRHICAHYSIERTIAQYAALYRCVARGKKLNRQPTETDQQTCVALRE
jgi:glycosyltransferase involved in cell wall biosynthesis